MRTVEESTIINVPRKEVWDYATDPVNQPVWKANVLEHEADREGQPEIGDRARNVGQLAGRRIESTQEVTEVVPGETFAFKSVDGPVAYAFTWRFEDTDEGTRFSVRGETPGLGGLFGAFGDTLVLRMLSRDIRFNLRNLKTILESADQRSNDK